MTQTLVALASLTAAAFVLVGVPLMVLYSELADERARSRCPHGSATVGGVSPERPPTRGTVSLPPRAVEPLPHPGLVDASTDPHPRVHQAGTSALPLPTNPGGHGVGDPQASRARWAEPPAGGVDHPASPAGHHPHGGDRG